jgi:hypothetical protein
MRPFALLSGLVPPARILSNSPRRQQELQRIRRGEPSKTIISKTVTKVKMPKKPKGCTVLSKIPKMPVKLLYCNTRQSHLLVSYWEANKDN